MQQPDNNLTYKQNMSKTEVLHVIGGIGIPLGVFCFSLMTISSLTYIKTPLITQMIGLMWISGLVVAFLMPSMRREVINQTMITITTYCFTLLGLKIIYGMVAGVSAEMISASLGQSMPMATGNALPGYLSNILMITTVMVPIGFIGMQGKRLLQFKHNQSLQKQMGRVRGIRPGGQGHTKPF